MGTTMNGYDTVSSAVVRTGGYAPLREYAAIGDGRTVALVARDGSIDWLPLPNLDSPTVFGAILDSRRGGRFELAPEPPFRASRRYLPLTNVLETTFETDQGAVRVVDALTLPTGGLDPFRELQRRIECLSGRVRLCWRVEPRFGYAAARTQLGLRGEAFVATHRGDALALVGARGGTRDGDSWSGSFDVVEGQRIVLALVCAHQEPLVFPPAADLDRRFQHTCTWWQRWADGRQYDGEWRDAVIRSALALKLLVYAPSGAIAAAATASLPEEIGGERNWDYRYSWIRDSAFTIDSFLRLGCGGETEAYFWWLMHATQLTAPRLRVLYRLDGGARTSERTLALAGYRDSQPVNIGNGAAEQLQLDTYGELLQTAWLYADAGNRIDPDIAARLAALADFVCDHWASPDAGIWEVRSEPVHFTQSKMMCAIALDRAVRLAECGLLPTRNATRWRATAAEVRDFVETRCWSEEKRSYMRFADAAELDASVLLGVLHGYPDQGGRLQLTVDAIRRELAEGPFVRRYTGDDGIAGGEGAFLACSFWLVEALACVGRRDEARELMTELMSLRNDVGLLSEEIDPETGEFLGNLPQGLSHLSLIRAAFALAEERE
jgi:GH15 family glucan-1,4-alpha-glucosidase